MNPHSKLELRIRPLRERLREETARVISAAAEQVFADRGVHQARMEEIASRAGVSVGTVYNHFEDRETLLAELVESRRKELARRLDRALATPDPFEGQLRRFVLTVFEHFEDHRPFCTIMLESDQARLTQPSPAMREIRARAETLVRRGLQKKVLRATHGELLPMMLWGAIKAVLVHDLRNPGALPVADRAAAAVDFFLNGTRA